MACAKNDDVVARLHKTNIHRLRRFTQIFSRSILLLALLICENLGNLRILFLPLTMTVQSEVRTRCVIVGGGPAGMMAGYLMARAGVNVIVLEKHADFFRDFRGDTIHPSTLELMHELGLLADFLKLPHQEAPVIKGRFGDLEITVADFRHLPTQAKFIALMPQWDFLNFLA